MAMVHHGTCIWCSAGACKECAHACRVQHDEQRRRLNPEGHAAEGLLFHDVHQDKQNTYSLNVAVRFP